MKFQYAVCILWARRRRGVEATQGRNATSRPFNVGGILGEINMNFPAGERRGSKPLGTLTGGVRCSAARPSKDSGKSNSRLYLPQADSVSCNQCSHRIHRIHTKSSCVHASHVRWVPSYDQNFVISTPEQLVRHLAQDITQYKGRSCWTPDSHDRLVRPAEP